MKYSIQINGIEVWAYSPKEVAQLLLGVRTEAWVFYHAPKQCVGFLLWKNGRINQFVSSHVPETDFISEEVEKLTREIANA